MRKLFSLLCICLLAVAGMSGVVVAKSNHYDYKIVDNEGNCHFITGGLGNYNPSQDSSSNRVTLYNVDIYDSNDNYVGRADVINYNKNSNNGAHVKLHVEETTPVGNVTEEVNITEEVVNNTTEVINITEDVNTTEEVNPIDIKDPSEGITPKWDDDEPTPSPRFKNTTNDNNVIGSGSMEIDENGTIVNGTAVIPGNPHMCDNIPLSCTNHNGNSKVVNHNSTVKVVNGTCNCTKAVNHTANHKCNCTCNCNCTHIVNVFIINELFHGHIIHDLLVFVIGFLVVLIVFLYRRFRR